VTWTIFLALAAIAGSGLYIFLRWRRSPKAKAHRESQHKIKLKLSVADKKGNPLKVRAEREHKDLIKKKTP